MCPERDQQHQLLRDLKMPAMFMTPYYPTSLIKSERDFHPGYKNHICRMTFQVQLPPSLKDEVYLTVQVLDVDMPPSVRMCVEHGNALFFSDRDHHCGFRPQPQRGYVDCIVPDSRGMFTINSDLTATDHVWHLHRDYRGFAVQINCKLESNYSHQSSFLPLRTALKSVY